MYKSIFEPDTFDSKTKASIIIELLYSYFSIYQNGTDQELRYIIAETKTLIRSYIIEVGEWTLRCSPAKHELAVLAQTVFLDIQQTKRNNRLSEDSNYFDALICSLILPLSENSNQTSWLRIKAILKRLLKITTEHLDLFIEDYITSLRTIFSTYKHLYIYTILSVCLSE